MVNKAAAKKEAYAGVKVVKSPKRKAFIEALTKILSDKKIVRYFDKSMGENGFNRLMRQGIADKLPRLLLSEYPDKDLAWRKRKAEDAVIWEKDANTVVNHTILFGVQHRPDLVVLNQDYRVAIEYKLVDRGEAVRAVLGQALVYASEYEFSICVLLDTTKEKNVASAFKKGAQEDILLKKLWDQFGIKVVVVSLS